MKAKDYHIQAEKLREEGKFEEALEMINQAIKLQENAELYQSRCLVYKHLFLGTREKKWLQLAKADASKSLQLEPKASSYFRIGEIAELEENWEEARNYFEKAVNKFDGKGAERGDFRYHWGSVEYQLGNKGKGEDLMREGLEEIEANTDNRESFLINVWSSGAHMKLAKLLITDKPDIAKAELEKAKAIIEGDPRLILRKRQLEKLSETFGTS